VGPSLTGEQLTTLLTGMGVDVTTRLARVAPHSSL